MDTETKDLAAQLALRIDVALRGVPDGDKLTVDVARLVGDDHPAVRELEIASTHLTRARQQLWVHRQGLGDQPGLRSWDSLLLDDAGVV